MQTRFSPAQLAENVEPLRRLLVLDERPLERQRRALRQDADVALRQPGDEVVGETVCLVVVARHDNERVRAREGAAPRRDERRARRGGHAQPPRSRQCPGQVMGERRDAAGAAAAGRGHGSRMVPPLRRSVRRGPAR